MCVQQAAAAVDVTVNTKSGTMRKVHSLEVNEVRKSDKDSSY